MVNSSVAEAYFIAAMMVLILILSAAAVIFFTRQYKKEKREKPLTRQDIKRMSEKASEQSGKTNDKKNEYVEK